MTSGEHVLLSYVLLPIVPAFPLRLLRATVTPDRSVELLERSRVCAAAVATTQRPVVRVRFQVNLQLSHFASSLLLPVHCMAGDREEEQRAYQEEGIETK
jgi:hypothetical protein